jgi:hypothetical protein
MSNICQPNLTGPQEAWHLDSCRFEAVIATGHGVTFVLEGTDNVMETVSD